MYVNAVQKVNVLPHERYDSSVKILNTMAKMKNVFSIRPRYHMDTMKLIETETYQNNENRKRLYHCDVLDTFSSCTE